MKLNGSERNGKWERFVIHETFRYVDNHFASQGIVCNNELE